MIEFNCRTEKYFVGEILYENDKTNTVIIEARDKKLNRDVILKQIKYEDERKKEIILKEIKSQIVLERYSDHIPLVHNVFVNEREHKISIEMTKIEGVSLRKKINDAMAFPNKDLNWYKNQLKTLIMICSTMANLHRYDMFVHKDLKPENTIINKAKQAAYIIDFGISGPGNNKVGTPDYMAPEQQKNIRNIFVCQATDVYALGQIGIELFTGSVLKFGKDLVYSPNSQTWIKEKDISNIGGSFYPKLGAILKKSIALDPKERYLNAKALESDLLSLLKGKYGKRANHN